MKPSDKFTVELQRAYIGVLLKALDIAISQTPCGAANPYRDMQNYLQGVMEPEVANMAKAWAEIDPPRRFRLIKEDTMEPLGDWGTNLQETMEYLERRPDWCPKYVCINERNDVIPAIVGVFNAQGKIIQVPWSEVPKYEGNEPWIDWETEEDKDARFEQAAEAAATATQHDPNLCRFCGSGCIDFGKNEPTVYCHDCKREYIESDYLEPDLTNQDQGEEDD